MLNIKHVGRFSLAATVAAIGFCYFPPQPAMSQEPPQETREQRDARMKWWREARFGMFIHWGVYSVPAGTYKDRKIGGIGEWIMHNAKIPVAEYKEYAKQFTAAKYNPEEWVLTAKEAGMRYMVITSKHHDGFALFDSRASDWNAVKASGAKRDLLKPLAEACQKHGMKLGFYYSQSQDWTNPGGEAFGGHWDKAQDGNYDEYLKNVAVPQVKEILTNYGPIAVLWYDTPKDMTKERAGLFIPLHQLQQGLIWNNRLGGGFHGDSETPEQFIPATGYPGRDWETCMTLNDTWGYKSYDNNWKSTETLVRNLVDIASKGGNYLLNVGPTSEGLIPEPSVQRLKEVGAWMKVNGEAIYATSASPFKKLPWGRCTRKVDGDLTTLFFHVFNWPADGRLMVPGLKNPAEGAYLLIDADKKSLATQSTDEGLTVTVPTAAPTPISSTVVVKVRGDLKIEQMPLLQAADGSLKLLAADAATHGDQIKSEGEAGRENIGFWTVSADWIEWEFKITKPGKFKVSAELACVGTNNFELTVGDKKLSGKAPKTGDYKKYQVVDLGAIEIVHAGRNSLALKAVREGWQPMNVRWVMLKPE